MTNTLKIMLLGLLMACSTEGLVMRQDSGGVEPSSGIVRGGYGEFDAGGSVDSLVAVVADTFIGTTSVDTTLQRDSLGKIDTQGQKDTFVQRDTILSQLDSLSKADVIVRGDTQIFENPEKNPCINPPTIIYANDLKNYPDMSNGQCVDIPLYYYHNDITVKEKQCDIFEGEGLCDPRSYPHYEACGYCKITCNRC